jgi:hypothetical protein
MIDLKRYAYSTREIRAIPLISELMDPTNIMDFTGVIGLSVL